MKNSTSKMKTFSQRHGALVFLLLAVFSINFAAMPALWFPGDPYAWREETRSLLRNGTLHINAHFAEASGERGQYFVFNPRNDQWYSKYGLMNSLMALPPVKLESLLTGRLPPEGALPNLLIFNLYNILLSLLVCTLLYQITGWYTQRSWIRIVYVLVASYATFLWYYQRAQTSEITQVLFFIAAFYFLMIYLRNLQSSQGRPDRKSILSLLVAWLFVSALLFTRVLFGLLIPTFWLAVGCATGGLEKKPRWPTLQRQLPWLLIPVLVMVAALARLNQVKFGSPWLTGYHQWRAVEHWPIGRWQDGIWGILFDPQGSILLHFPILIFALLALREFYRRFKLDAMVIFLLPSLLVLLLTKIPLWRGEWSYGPRLLIFMLPILSLPFLLYLERLTTAPRNRANWILIAVTTITLGYSTWLQFEANRLGYFTMYEAIEPISGNWTREMARYFLEHQMGTFNADLLRHRDNLDSLPYVADLKARGVSDQRLQQYKDILRTLANENNFYWTHPPTPAVH